MLSADDAPPGQAADDQGLGGQVRRGLTWSFANNLLSRLGTMAFGVVLARVLVPQDYGVFAVALVVLNAILSVNELGVSVAVVRWPGRTDEIAPTVVTISIVSSCLLYAACYVLAPEVASSLHAARAAGLIRVLSLCVLFDGAAAVSAAVMVRAFQQRKRAVIDLVSLVIGSGLSVALAVAGFGAWSMVWGLLASNLLASGLSIAWTRPRYAPGWNAAVLRPLLSFSLPLAAASLLMFFMLNVDYVVVGHVLGASALGYYLLAFNLSSWPVVMVSTAVRRVSLAGFSRLAEQPSRIGESFARAAGILFAVALPMAVLMAVFAHPLIGFAYGAKWDRAADVLRLLCVLGTVRVVTELAYDFLVALGRPRPNLWLQALWGACLVPALVIGARWHGLVGVAGAHAVVAAGVVIPGYLIALRSAGVELRRVFAHTVRPAVGGLLIAGAGLVALRVVPGDLPKLVVGGCVGLVLYVLVVKPMRSLLTTSELLLAAPPEPGPLELASLEPVPTAVEVAS